MPGSDSHFLWSGRESRWLCDRTNPTGRRTSFSKRQMHQSLVAYRATGAELRRSYYLALLAEAYGKGGQAKEGLTVIAEALALVGKTGERFYEAELYRLKGELTLQQFNVQGSKLNVANPQPLTPTPQAEAE